MKTVVGLTGGTGVGKSTFAELLAEHGAVVVDCDQLGRDVVGPGGGALAGIFEAFGAEVRAADGTLDRAALASIVFADAGSLSTLNAITHPAIDQLIRAAIDEAPPESILVLDMAVLVESELGAGQYTKVVVVESELALRIERLRGRGMAEDDAKARIASQATDEERRMVADHIITNNGTIDDLRKAAATLWADLQPRP